MGEIILLTGEFQSGKTTLCLELYVLAREAQLEVKGVISPAVFEGDEKIAIEALDLQSGVRKRLAELRGSQERSLDTLRWSFFPEVIAWGNKLLLEAVPCDLLLIDELGPLEFQRGEGWVNGFTAVDSGDFQAAILVIRPNLVKEAERRWKVSRVVDLDQNSLDPALFRDLFGRISSS